MFENFEIQNFLFDNIQYFVGICGGLGTFIFIKNRRIKQSKNDLTPFILKLNKQKESINKRTKSIL